MRSENEVRRLTQGGITSQVIDSAITSFILQAPSYTAATGVYKLPSDHKGSLDIVFKCKCKKSKVLAHAAVYDVRPDDRAARAPGGAAV